MITNGNTRKANTRARRPRQAAIGQDRTERGLANLSMTQQGPWAISNEARAALERCQLFRELTRQQLMEVAALVEEDTVSADSYLLREGEPARYIFVVIKGCGAAELALDHGWLSLGLVNPGDAAGWSSLIDGQTYPASVKALTPMHVARIEAKGLELLMNLEPSLGYAIQRPLSSIFYRQYQAALKSLKTA